LALHYVCDCLVLHVSAAYVPHFLCGTLARWVTGSGWVHHLAVARRHRLMRRRPRWWLPVFRSSRGSIVLVGQVTRSPDFVVDARLTGHGFAWPMSLLQQQPCPPRSSPPATPSNHLIIVITVYTRRLLTETFNALTIWLEQCSVIW